MSYRVFLSEAAERDLEDLSRSVKDKILKELSSLAADPRPFGCKKLAGTAHNWRLRIRSWRVLYSIDDAERIVRVYRIKHRKEAYR